MCLFRTPDAIRTRDLRLRRPLLYPAELPGLKSTGPALALQAHFCASYGPQPRLGYGKKGFQPSSGLNRFGIVLRISDVTRAFITKLGGAFWLTLAVLPMGVSGQTVIHIGGDSISVAQFASGYGPYLDASRRPDSLPARLDFIHAFTGQSIREQVGRDSGLERRPDILVTGDRAWRESLLHEAATAFFPDELNVPPGEIEALYRFRNPALFTRHLSLPDSPAANETRRRLMAGEPFEALALEIFGAGSLLESPGRPTWKFPRELDSTYARHAYGLEPGELSQPLISGDQFVLIELLDKQFRPDHGHFERVKVQQKIAGDLLPGRRAVTARQGLTRWAADLPVRWRRRGLRKVLRSGLLAGPLGSVQIPPADLAVEALLTINDEPYTLEWVVARLDLLPLDYRAGVTSLDDLRNLTLRLLKWDRLMVLVSSLPGGEIALERADSLRLAAIRQAVIDSLRVRLFRQTVVPGDSLMQLAVRHRGRYALPALLALEEIVVRDSSLAAALRDSLLSGEAPFTALARRHTLRLWARETGGDLGWMRLEVYGKLADSLAAVAITRPGRLVGPLRVDGHYLLARPTAFREETLPPLEVLRPRLRRDWLAAHEARLTAAWLDGLKANAYPTHIDTALLARLVPDATGRLILPPEPQPPLAGLPRANDSVQEEMPPQVELPGSSSPLPGPGPQPPDSTLRELPPASP